MLSSQVDESSGQTEPPPHMEPSSNHTTSSSDIDLEGKKISSSPSLDSAYLVEFNGEHDARNPLNFSPVRKWLIVTIVAWGSLLVTATSFLYNSCYGQLDKEFGSSQIVATLGPSLFVVGLAVGPMVTIPLSEFYGR
ncbi:hypothetical protein BJ875DRAFT_485203 [Amylocarpus encephaloides]|uniref:Major facilitator superfamily (MFS) profile domain-containing protein n=1 Tax=Amylocarpus encephaloides TaxID=45428 RepID=A0A9P7YI27_9HELO|nr:hypothetical protein BJ875DRAFT_485203 [Amylocarpus encephaloides]